MLSKLSRWPMLNPMTTEQRIAELQTSVRYSRTSVSRERVMSDWRIAMAEQKQPKRLVDSNESNKPAARRPPVTAGVRLSRRCVDW